MLGDVLDRLIEDLDSYVTEAELGDPFFSGSGYKAYPFSVENFREIKLVESGRKIAFVDGGNQEIVGAPNFSVQINRVFFNIFQDKRRILERKIPRRIEFFSVTYSRFRDNEIFYDTSIFPVSEEFEPFLPDVKDLSFSSMDRSVMQGNLRADISLVSSISRRFAEWEFSKHVIKNELEEKDVIVMDGTLQTAFTNESKYSKAVYELAKKKNIIVTGLTKTCGLFTTTGLSLLGAARKFANNNKITYPMWYYYPVAEAFSPIHEAIILLVKLNPVSERIFRFEIYRDQAKRLSIKEIDEIMSSLSSNSADITFPGYPYGLIDADSNARVRHDEMQRYRYALLSTMSKKGIWKKLVKHIQARDAHDKLNEITRWEE
ncbi:MAG: DNA double-strand break repair nuclease NurA [Candidatus Jordarchaeaceae archaeon]